jgi:hypothetical protein
MAGIGRLAEEGDTARHVAADPELEPGGGLHELRSRQVVDAGGRPLDDAGDPESVIQQAGVVSPGRSAPA